MYDRYCCQDVSVDLSHLGAALETLRDAFFATADCHSPAPSEVTDVLTA